MGLCQFNGFNQGLATLALDSRATPVILKIIFSNTIQIVVRFSRTIELNNILHYWFQKRSNDFSSCVATLLLRWNVYTYIYTPTAFFLIYNIHNFLPGLLGYLILFAPQAFVL